MRRVPFDGDEKRSLYVSLDRHRDLVPWKLAGLTDEQARRPMTPSGLNLLGLVQHLAVTEYGWFCETFGGATEPYPFDPAEPDADFRVGADRGIDDVLAYYARARAASDAVIAAHEVTDSATAETGAVVTLRWVLIHMIEETARHAGHLDILRELIDGSGGDHPPDA